MICGIMLFGLIILQVLLGVMAYFLKRSKMPFMPIKIIRHIHQYLGYIMYVMYNVLLLVAWYPGDFFNGFVAWDCFWFLVWIFVKFFQPGMNRKIIDSQTVNYICPSIGNVDEV
jgi:hypothetical protein